MQPCNKRQKVVKRSKGLTLFRCLNKKCGFYGQEVCGDICSRCPVRSEKHQRPCRNIARSGPPVTRVQPVTTQEMIDVTDEQVREMIEEAGLDITDINKAQAKGGTPSNYPPLSMQLWTYKEALIRWNKAGRPTRTKEEVIHIEGSFCNPPGKPCEWYDLEQKRCTGCGCKVTVGSIAVLNKIKMGTEHCPKELW